MRWMTSAISCLLTTVALSGQGQRSAIIDLWISGKPAFGIYAPNENALGGDREGVEAGTQKVLAEAKRVKLVDMLTFNAQDAERRVKEGFLALRAGTEVTAKRAPGRR